MHAEGSLISSWSSFDCSRSESGGGGVRGILRKRASSFSMLLLIGFLLMVSLGAGATLSALSGQIAGLFPGAAVASRLADVLVSLLITSGLFALLFKVLPDLPIRWGDVLIGAVFTALLFSVGRLGIAIRRRPWRSP